MVRAWAISVLMGFETDERYQKSVQALLRDARADSAGSIQARLRRLGRNKKKPTPRSCTARSAIRKGRAPAFQR